MSRALQEADKRVRWRAFIESLNSDIDPRTVRLMEEMRIVSHALYQISERSLADLGLSFAQYRILLSLLFVEHEGEGQGLHPSQISERQGTSRNTISSLIRSLEERDLVERLLNKNDRRKFNIRLTEEGRTLAREHASEHFRLIGDCFADLTADEQQTLSRLLSKISLSAGACAR